MKIALDVAEMFGDDIKHLHGNLYRVRRSRIRMARAGLSVDNGRLVYGNPRWFVNKNGEREARGIESSKMDELKHSIQHSGLDNPIRLRPVESDENFLEIVNGERRFRCISMLCDEGSICHDAAVGDKATAEDVYEWVDCRIDRMDDCEALGVALKTNETSEVIGDLANIEVVKALRDAGYDDSEILKATGKSVSWLRETDRIIGLDEVCLDHFQRDQITRKAALQLALIENAEERISLLESIVSIARNRRESKIRQLDRQIDDAETKELINNAAAEVANKIGDEEQAERLAAAGRKAKKKMESAKGERERVSSKPAKADARDIKKVNSSKKSREEVDDSESEEHLMSQYMEVIEQVIASQGFDEDGNSYGLDIGLLSVVGGVLGAIIMGLDNPMEVFAEHCPLVIEDEETEESEDDEDSDHDDESESDEYDDEESEDYEEEESDLLNSDDEDEEEEEEEDETPPELENEFRQASFYDDEEDDN